MKPMSLRVFVGSSVENRDVASAIQSNLRYDADVRVWPQAVFNLTSNALDDLLRELDESDFGVFVFTPDDTVQIKDQRLSCVRDNVLLEFGLFVGRLGKERTFYFLPRDVQGFRLPTDLLGVTPATYDPTTENLQAALGSDCDKIRQTIQKLGISRNRKDTVMFGQGKTSEFWNVFFSDYGPNKNEEIYVVFSAKDKGYEFIGLKPDLSQVGHTVKLSYNEVFAYINLQKELRPVRDNIEVIHGGVDYEIEINGERKRIRQPPHPYNPRAKLIIIGSPHASLICKETLEKLKTEIPYRFETNESNEPRYKYIGAYTSAGKVSYPATYKESEMLDKLDKDYGIILRIKNPHEGAGNNKILVLGGNHGHGTQAAIQALSEHDLINKIHRKVGKNDFEALFKSDATEAQKATIHPLRISVLEGSEWREIDVQEL